MIEFIIIISISIFAFYILRKLDLFRQAENKLFRNAGANDDNYDDWLGV